MTANRSKHMGRCGEFTITERLTGTRSAYYVARDADRMVTSTDFATLVFKLREEKARAK